MATIITRTILEMSNDVSVKGLERPVTNPWYFDYATRIPEPEPPLYTREIFVTPLPYEERDTCLLNNNKKYKLNLELVTYKEIRLTATEQEYQDALAGIDGNIGTLLVTKLVAELASIFGGNYATVKTYQIDIDTTPPTITDVTP